MTDTNPLLSTAFWYAQNFNWKILPTHGLRPDGRCTCGKPHADPKDVGKHPAFGNWQNDATDNTATIQGWWEHDPDYNVGVFARDSGFFVLDIDPRNGGDESYYKLEERLGGDIPNTITQITGQYTIRGQVVRGRHMFFKAPEGFTFMRDLGKLGLPGIDIKHNGYALLYPSRHITGVQYEWDPERAPWNTEMAEPSEAMMSYFARKGGGGFRSGGGQRREGGAGGLWDFVASLDDENGEKMDLDRFMDQGVAEGSRAVDIHRIACSLANKLGTDAIARESVIATMQKFNAEKVVPPLPMDELMMHVERAIEFVAANPKRDLNQNAALGREIGTVLKNTSAFKQDDSPIKIHTMKAKEAREENRTDDEDFQSDVPQFESAVPMALDADALSEEDGGTAGGRTMTDTGNGRRFVDAFGNILRYTPGLGFFLWNNEYWMPDVEELGVRESAKKLSAIVGAEAGTITDKDEAKAALKWARDTKSNARQSAAIESAKSDPRIFVPVEAWDFDPYLLGVKNGVVNLRTGELIQGRADLHITRRAPVAYQPGFDSLPRFREFLNFATHGDVEYQNWLQRAFGYTLTGLRTLDVFFLMYGPPGTGKNVLVEAFVKALGTKQYALPLPSEVLGSGDGKANNSDQYYWAEMRGRRMIWVDELPETERMKENQVKKLTGSSEIQARSPGERPFTFESQAKLWATTNHRPIITDDAMWRRLRPIPWDRQPTTPDPTLKAYLHDPDSGLPAILAWAIEGAQQFINSTDPDPLGWCQRVKDAHEVYRKNEDRLGMFLEEEMEPHPTAEISIKAMYAPYQAWSEGRGERAMSQIAFTRKLQDRGVQVSGSGSRAMVLGFTTRAPQQGSGGFGAASFNWGGMPGQNRQNPSDDGWA
ncbi:DNA primase/polymerase/helicase [Microbacterium phage Cece]|nr:DNA primase/polymerase/helicase [Microbacterium phage Cece]